MPSNLERRLLAGIVCVLVVMSGCSGLSSEPQPTTTTVEPAPVTDAQSTPTAPPTTADISRGGLLIVESVGNTSGANASDVVRYDRTVFGRSPTLDDALTEAVSTTTTQQRDLSGQEIQRIESVADAYNVSTGGFVVHKNGSAVRVSVGYEL